MAAGAIVKISRIATRVGWIWPFAPERVPVQLNSTVKPAECILEHNVIKTIGYSAGGLTRAERCTGGGGGAGITEEGANCLRGRDPIRKESVARAGAEELFRRCGTGTGKCCPAAAKRQSAACPE